MAHDWQAQMARMVSGHDPLSGEAFLGGPTLTPEEQIGVYREQYRMRLRDAVAEDVPGWCILVGERAERCIDSYLVDHPVASWTLLRVAAAFPAWLQRSGSALHESEMARLDLAVLEGFTASDELPVDAQGLADVASGRVSLGLQAHVRLLRLANNVHCVRSAALAGEPVPEVERGDFRVVTFRADRRMRHREAAPGEWAALSALGAGASVAEAIDAAVVASGEDVAAAGVGAWFQGFIARNWLSVR